MRNFESDKFYLPYQNPFAKGDDDYWVVEPINTDDEGRCILSQFNFTVFTQFEDRLTFKYVNNTVVPAPRTYKWYGVNANKIAGRYLTNKRPRKQPSWEDTHTMPYDNEYFGKVFDRYYTMHEDELDAERHAVLDFFADQLDEEDYINEVRQDFPQYSPIEVLLGKWRNQG